MSRLSRSVFDILSGNIMLRLLGVVFTPLLVRALSKAEYGEFIGLLAIFQAINRLATGGLFQATTKYTSESEPGERGTVLGGSLTLSTVYSVVAGAILLSAVWWFGPVGFGETIFVYFAVLSVLFRNPVVVVRGFLYGVHEERISQGVIVFRKTLYTIGGLAVAYTGYGVVSILGVYVFSYAVVIVSVLLVGIRFVQSRIQPIALDRDVTYRIASFGAIHIVGFMSALLLYKTDIILIRYFLDDTSVAEYQAALFPAELVWIVPAAIQGALLQNTASEWADGRVEKVSETLLTGVKYGTMSLILFGVGLFVLAEDFLFLYFGPEYVTSATLLQILLFGSVVYGINRVYIPVLQAIGELKRQQATNVIALGVNIVLNLVLIPRFGTIGAASATSLSYASVILGSVLILHSTPVRSPSVRLASKLAVLFIGFVALYAVPVLVITASPLQSLVVFPVFGAFVFALLSHELGLFTVTDARRLL